MESSFKSELFIENLLDFSSDIGEEDEDDAKKKNHHHRTSELDHDSHPMLAAEEEELEWLSNRDAFPPIETFDYILSETDTKPNLPFLSLSSPPPPQSKNHSPVSVLGTSSFHHFPVQARSKRRRKRRTNYTDVASGQKWWWCCEPKKRSAASAASSTSSETYEGGVVRKCQHCQVEKTPQWRAGPFGPKTLCNACGVRYKSGRLFPEYRPANSPSFSSRLHSNSHRKILDMRKQKQKQVVMQPRPMPPAFDYGR